MSESRRLSLFWCGLAVAFSPVIQNLAENLAEHPGDRYTLLPILLMGLLLRNDAGSHSDTRPALGAALLLIGLAAQIIGIAGGSWSIGRVGLPVAMLGMTFMTGRPAVTVVLLAFALVPVPDFVQNMASPTVESALVAFGSGVWARLGVAMMEVGGPLLQHHGERFELLASDTGIVTAVVLAQVGWYFSLRAGCAPGQSVLWAVGWGLVAAIVQPVLVLVCIASLPLGFPDVGRFCLTHGPWLLLSSAILLHHARDV